MAVKTGGASRSRPQRRARARTTPRPHAQRAEPQARAALDPYKNYSAMPVLSLATFCASAMSSTRSARIFGLAAMVAFEFMV